MPQLPASSGNSSQRLKCSSLTNSPTNSSLSCTALTQLGWSRNIALERPTRKHCLQQYLHYCLATAMAIVSFVSRLLPSNGSVCHIMIQDDSIGGNSKLIIINHIVICHKNETCCVHLLLDVEIILLQKMMNCFPLCLGTQADTVLHICKCCSHHGRMDCRLNEMA
jgi:hypothetical protein